MKGSKLTVDESVRAYEILNNIPVMEKKRRLKQLNIVLLCLDDAVWY
jgi:hypothetical protein